MIATAGYENIDWGVLSTDDPIRIRHEFRYNMAAEFACGLTVDAACGYGCGSIRLAAKVDSVVGFDRDHKALEIAERCYSYHPSHAIEFHLADLDQPAIPDCHYLVCIETLEHLRDPGGFMDRAMQVANRIFLSTPIVPTTHHNRFHVHDFTLPQLQSLFNPDIWRCLFLGVQESTYGLLCYQRR